MISYLHTMRRPRKPAMKPGYNIWSLNGFWYWSYVSSNGTMMAKCGAGLTSKANIQRSLNRFIKLVKTYYTPIHFHD